MLRPGSSLANPTRLCLLLFYAFPPEAFAITLNEGLSILQPRKSVSIQLLTTALPHSLARSEPRRGDAAHGG